MTSKRIILLDFLTHAAVYGWVCTLAALLTFAVSRDAGLTYRVAGGFSLVFWAYWGVRCMLRAASGHRADLAAYSKNANLFFIGTLIIAVLACDYFNFSIIPPFAYASAVLCFLTQVLRLHIVGIDQTLDAVSHFSTQPAAAIRRHNNRIIALFTLLAALVILFLFIYFSPERINAWLASLWDAFVTFVRWLFRNSGETPQAAAPLAEEPAPDGMMGIPEGEPNLFMRIVGWIIRYYFLALTVLGFVALFFMIYYNVKGFRFRKRVQVMDNGDVSETVAPEPGEWIAERIFRAGRMPSDPVRRAFYKKVRKHRDMVEKSDTANQMAGKIKEREDIDALTELYQEARYR
jgi:hypothetical protein